MSVSSICPDDLLLAARRSELAPSEEARLAFHLERCARCRAALATGRAFDVVLGARAGDDEIAMRIAARLTAHKSSRFWPLGLLARSPLRGLPARKGLRAISAGLMLSASLAVAAVGVQRLRVSFQDAKLEPAVAPGSDVQPARAAGLSRGLTHGAAAASGQAGLLEALPLPSAAVEVEPNTHATKARASVSRGTMRAAELFAQANALRGAGKRQEAQQRYLELQGRYPESSEARVSLVSLGRLELATEPALALRHFNAYLAQASHQTLSEEALFGQATALLRLGKVEQERAAWRKLLERYPSSVYAERAKARLSP